MTIHLSPEARTRLEGLAAREREQHHPISAEAVDRALSTIDSQAARIERLEADYLTKSDWRVIHSALAMQRDLNRSLEVRQSAARVLKKLNERRARQALGDENA